MVKVGVVRTLGKPMPSFLPVISQAEWISLPVQKVLPLVTQFCLKNTLASKTSYMFSSVAVFELFPELNSRDFFEGREIWVVGRKTLKRVQDLGGIATYFGNTLKELLASVSESQSELQLVHYCSSKTRALVSDFLKIGVGLQNVKVYEPRVLEKSDPIVMNAQLELIGLSTILFYSSSQVLSSFNLWGREIHKLVRDRKLRFWCLGESAFEALKMEGLSRESYELLADKPVDWSEKIQFKVLSK